CPPLRTASSLRGVERGWPGGVRLERPPSPQTRLSHVGRDQRVRRCPRGWTRRGESALRRAVRDAQNRRRPSRACRHRPPQRGLDRAPPRVRLHAGGTIHRTGPEVRALLGRRLVRTPPVLARFPSGSCLRLPRWFTYSKSRLFWKGPNDSLERQTAKRPMTACVMVSGRGDTL